MTYMKELQMLQFFKYDLLSVLLILIVFGGQVVAQSEFDQLVADVKRISELPNAHPSEVDRLNKQLRQIDNLEEIPALMALRAVPLTELIEKFAEQIDMQMRNGNFARIGVPEFTTSEDRTFDPTYGALPRSIAESLRNVLAKKAQGSYSILSEDALYKTLKNKGIAPGDLAGDLIAGKTKNLQNEADGKEISLLVDGRMNRVGEIGITLRVDLIDNTTGSKLDYQFAGTALLNSDELAISGISAKFGISTPGSSLRYRLEPGVGLVLDRDFAKVRSIRGAVVEPHPLSQAGAADGTFDVWIETRRSNSRGAYSKLPSNQVRFWGNDYYIGLFKGDEFRIMFKASASDDIFVRVLVDGLNTLSQHQKVVSGGTRGAYVVPVPDNSEGELVVAPRVYLEEARPWVVPKKDSGKQFAVSGFYNVDGKTDTLRRFQVVDADESAAARKNYTEQIGLITVAFYKGKPGTPTPSSRGSVGTGMGNVEQTKVERYTGDNVPGDMVVVYNIRYMTPEALKQIMK